MEMPLPEKGVSRQPAFAGENSYLWLVSLSVIERHILSTGVHSSRGLLPSLVLLDCSYDDRHTYHSIYAYY